MQPIESNEAKQPGGATIQVMGGSPVVIAGDVNITRSTLIGHAGHTRGRIRTPWRTLTIAAIKARCVNDLGDANFYREHVACTFGKASLRELTDDELQQTKCYVFEMPVRA